jgi:hypothetical protein
MSTAPCFGVVGADPLYYTPKSASWLNVVEGFFVKLTKRRLSEACSDPSEPVTGHIKAEHRMDRNYLKGRDGDRSPGGSGDLVMAGFREGPEGAAAIS